MAKRLILSKKFQEIFQGRTWITGTSLNNVRFYSTTALKDIYFNLYDKSFSMDDTESAEKQMWKQSVKKSQRLKWLRREIVCQIIKFIEAQPEEKEEVVVVDLGRISSLHRRLGLSTVRTYKTVGLIQQAIDNGKLVYHDKNVVVVAVPSQALKDRNFIYEQEKLGLVKRSGFAKDINQPNKKGECRIFTFFYRSQKIDFRIDPKTARIPQKFIDTAKTIKKYIDQLHDDLALAMEKDEKSLASEILKEITYQMDRLGTWLKLVILDEDPPPI